MEVFNAAAKKVRLVDLAREVGLSVQSVRQYSELGFLPPVSRTASGYRVFTAQHATALRVVRVLIEGYGYDRALEVMRAAHAGKRDRVLALVDASHAELHEERRRIDRVLAAFEAVVLRPPPEPPPLMRVGQVARALGVRTSALRLWEKRGLLKPARDRATGYRVYDRRQQRNAQLVALLRKGGYGIDLIRSVLDELRSTDDSRKPERVRAELARREADLDRLSARRLRATAALHGYLDA
jgi:DNA-binding transcriptional MerR regulator